MTYKTWPIYYFSRKDNIFSFIVEDSNFYPGYIRRNFMLMISFWLLWREALRGHKSGPRLWKVIKLPVAPIMGLVCHGTVWQKKKWYSGKIWNLIRDTAKSNVLYREKKGWKTYEGIRTAKSQTDNEQGCRQNHFNFVPTFYFKLRSHTVSHLLQPWENINLVIHSKPSLPPKNQKWKNVVKTEIIFLERIQTNPIQHKKGVFF